MSQTYSPAAPVTSGTSASVRRILLAVWAAFTLGAVAFVAAIGTNAPYADEWEFVPALVGEEPALPWLWRQHNEHRLPLPRAVFLALFKLTHDFRAGMLLQVAMLSALALYLMRIAAQLRGAPHWADCFFPISLLHVGHWENFVMGYQVCFVLFAVLATAIAVIALRITRENAFRSGAVASVLLTLLALTGGSGLVVVPPIVAWLAYVAICVWRSGERGRAALLVLLIALPVAYLGVYFVGYEKPRGHPELSANAFAVARVAGEVLAVSFGMGVSLVWWAVVAGMLALGSCTLALLFGRWSEPGERLSVVGLVAVAAGVTGVALAIGVGRGGWGAGMGLWSRYSLLAWPLLATTYLAWVKFGHCDSRPVARRAGLHGRCGEDSRPVARRAGLHGRSRWVPILLCAVAALAFPGNTGTGMVNGAAIKSEYSAIEADAALGLAAEQIADAEDARSERFPQTTAAVLQRDRAIRGIPMLRAARVGIFAR